MPLTARDIMTPNPVTVQPETTIAEASRLLLEHRFNGLPVVDARGMLKGILCQSDLVAQHKSFAVPSFFTLLDGYIPLQFPGKIEDQLQRMSAMLVGEVMTPHPRTVDPGTPVDVIAGLMVDEHYHTLPVVELDRLVGVIGKTDILRTVAR